MIEKLSIILRGGVEAYSYKSPLFKENKDSQLLSGLFYAIQSVSEEINDPVSFIRLQNSVIYVKTYSDFSLLLIFSDIINTDEIEDLFQDLAKLTLKFFDKIQKFEFPGLFKEKIEILISTSNFSNNYHSSISLDFDTSIKRIAIVGLGNAGKTSIKHLFFDNWNVNSIKGIRPTLGLETSKNDISFLNESIIALDFGGQQSYRKNYLENSQLWSNLSSLIYVVDIQEEDQFLESKAFLDKIYNLITEKNKSKMNLSIFIHKYDPDKIQVNRANLDKFFYIYKDYYDKAFFYFSSIYNESCVNAFMKTLFLSLPSIMVKQILERNLIDKIEFEVINEDNVENLKKLDQVALHDLGFAMGKRISDIFQIQWLNSYFGRINPTPRGILAKQINFKVEKQKIRIEIENWTLKNIFPDITDPILTGSIKGILSSLILNDQVSVIQEKHKTIWIIDVN